MGGVRASWGRASNLSAIRQGEGALRARTEKKNRPALQHSLLEVEGGMREVGGTAKIAPVVFVGSEGEDFFSFGGDAKVGVDDRKGAFFAEHSEEARRNDVDAGEGERQR